VKYTNIYTKQANGRWSLTGGACEFVDAVGEGSTTETETTKTVIGYKYAEFQVFQYNSTSKCYAMSDRFYELSTKNYALSAPTYTYDPNNLPDTFATVTYQSEDGNTTYATGVYVKGAAVSTYKADVDSDAAFEADTEVVENGIFNESKFRSAPYFDLRIDGITLVNEKF
jgi:hypothetical protein